jgi:hypothetical protein
VSKNDAEVKVGADTSALKRAAEAGKAAFVDAARAITSAFGDASRQVAASLGGIVTAQGKVNFAAQHAERPRI